MKRLELTWLLVVACGAFAPRVMAEDEPVETPEPLACDADLKCPPPLACDAAAEGGPRCVWQANECADVDNCPARFECVEPSRYGDCTECAEGAEGEECASVPCQGPSFCEPEQIACSQDADCPADWTCTTLFDHPVPAYWEVSEGDVGCVPNGAIAIAEGRVYITLESSAGGEVPEASATGAPAEEDGAAGSEAASSDVDRMKPGSTTESTANACSTAAPGARQGGTFALALLALAWFVRRRAVAAR